MSTDFSPLLNSLRALKASGEAGFEGLFRDILQRIVGHPLHLLKSGPQKGKDIVSDVNHSSVHLALEAKRFDGKTDLPLDELKSKLQEAVKAIPAPDVWGGILSREMKEPDLSELQKIGDEHGTTVIYLDWRGSPGSLPVLAALCAECADLAEQRLTGNLSQIFSEIRAHPDFISIITDVKKRLTRSDTGFDQAKRACDQWLNATVSSLDLSKKNLRSHADVRGQETNYVPRLEVLGSLDAWWSSEQRGAAVLLGDEGRGKTWAALDWCIRKSEKTSSVLLLVISAKDVQSADSQEVLGATMSRCMPSVNRDALQKRIRRWISTEGTTNKILLLIDGLNEAWDKPWQDIIRSLDAPDWRENVRIVMTCRKAFWQDSLQRLQGSTESQIKEIDVPLLNDKELNDLLKSFGLKKEDLSSALLNLIRVPRFAKLAISLKDKLRDTEDITAAHLILEDWKSRVEQKGADIPLDYEGLLQFVKVLGEAVLKDQNFSISAREIYEILSKDSGENAEKYKNTLNEIVEGHWLLRSEQAHRYQVNERLLPYAIGLGLAEDIKNLSDEADIENTIAKYEDPLRGSDAGVAILRAAASITILRQKTTKEARKLLLLKWINSQNFSSSDFQEMWPLISRDPELFLEIAQSHWKENPVGYRAGEVLLKGLSNAAKWPIVHECLVRQLPFWVGAFGLDPLHWNYGKQYPPKEERKKRTQANLLSWLQDEEIYGQKLSQYFRLDEDDYLPEAALSIISYLPRAPFTNTLIVFLVTRSIMQENFSIDQLNWLFRLNLYDHNILEQAVISEAEILKKCSSGVASETLAGLLKALSSPEFTNSTSIQAQRRHYFHFMLNENNEIIYTTPETEEKKITDINWIKQLGRFAENPDAVLLPADQEKLEIILKSKDFLDSRGSTFEIQEPQYAKALARWAPYKLAEIIQKSFSSLPEGDQRSLTSFSRDVKGFAFWVDESQRQLLRDAVLKKLRSVPEQDQA